MDVDYAVFGVLNYEQLDKFCKLTGVQSQDIRANFDGWRKLILFTEERVFLFPRDPNGVEWLDIELTTYEFLNNLKTLPIPRFIKRFNVPDISFYEFAEVSRLKGIAYSKIEDNLTLEQLLRIQTSLVRLFSIWHNIPLKEIPSAITQRKIYDPERYEFEIKLLSVETWEEAFNFVYNQILKYIRENNLNQFDILSEEETMKLWKNSIREIVALNHVLLHGDIHEDQILVATKDNLEITGILDWETVRVDNPIWEFNFGEWGFGIWKWWENFPEIRRRIWREYLDGRNTDLSSFEGLNLIYTLFEFLITFNPQMNLATLISKNQQESTKKCLERLIETTKRMKEE